MNRRRIKSLDRYDPNSRASLTGHDWPTWLRLIERKRKLLFRIHGSATPPLSDPFIVLATLCSFRLDGIAVTLEDVAAAITRGNHRRTIRSHQQQRIRGHVAILKRIDAMLRILQPIKMGAALSWYASIGGGLTTSRLNDASLVRLAEILRRINSPQLRLQSAVQEIAELHARLHADPLMPSFNGIFSRLLLRYHLGRCSLPPVLFDVTVDLDSLADTDAALSLIMRGIDASLDMLRQEAESDTDSSTNGTEAV